jgi:hypothetical protein
MLGRRGGPWAEAMASDVTIPAMTNFFTILAVLPHRNAPWVPKPQEFPKHVNDPLEPTDSEYSELCAATLASAVSRVYRISSVRLC